MDIIFRGRRTGVQERFREYAAAKLDKIVKLDQKAISIDVEVTLERNPRQAAQRERVELTVHSRGPLIRAEAGADDRFLALDRALAKLETHMRRACDRRKARNTGHGAPATIEALAAQPAIEISLPSPVEADDAAGDRRPGPAPIDVPDWLDTQVEMVGGVPIPMDGNGPLVVREKFHAATPMTIDRALHEMELVGHDFFLFRDEACQLPSVVYRRRGYDYGVIRLVEQTSVMADGVPARHATGHMDRQVGQKRFTG